MSVGASTAALECSGQMLLLWSDEPNSASQKELVDLLEARFEEVVIRSARKVRETTQVYLMGEQYTGTGIVRTFRKDDNSFILTIHVDEASPFRHNSELDPGVFAVDDFLTEQQEAEILRDLGNDIHIAPSCATI
jgi:hypothetical protein